MKVLLISNHLFSCGGVSRVLSVVASELSKTHDVTVLVLENNDKEDRMKYGLSPAVHVDYADDIYRKCYLRRAVHKLNQKTGLLKKLNSPFLYDWTYLPQRMQDTWIEYINQNHFDVVCGVQANIAIVLGKIKDRIHCKAIGWQHSSYEAYLETKGLYYYNQDYLFDKYIRKLDRYIVLNEHDERMFKQKMNIDAVTIYNPRSFESDTKSAVENRQFIACGHLIPTKGYDLLLESFDVFCRHDKEWILNIYGEGRDQGKLQKFIDAKGLSHRVFLRGVTNDIAKEMVGSSALLLSSRWEGMPMVVLEAMECGLPVVAYDINAITPLVDDGVEGRVVPSFDTDKFADAMLEIAHDEKKRKFFGQNAARKACQFSPEEIGKKWEEIIND